MSTKRNNIKIVLTGGHGATTALAVAEELIRRSGNKTGWEIHWIGSKTAFEGKKEPTLESEAFPKLGVKSFPIIAGRLQIKFSLWTIPSLAKFPIGFFQAFFYLKKIKPKIILSFGGFAAFPIVVVGWLLKIPVVIHDQTAAIGRANKFSIPFAKKIALARKSSLRYAPKEKSVITGNPILTQITKVGAKKEKTSDPVILITGGSRGSQRLNKRIYVAIRVLLKKYIVIHQTGPLDYKKFQKLRKTLTKDLKKRYEVYSRIDPMQMDGVYKRSDIIIARAGANTVSEIMVIKRPTLFVPLPFAYKNEQEENAKIAVKFGIAKIIPESNLTKELLIQEINIIDNNWHNIVSRVSDKNSPDLSASGNVVDLLEKLIA